MKQAFMETDELLYNTALMDIMGILHEPLFDKNILIDEVDRVYLAIKKGSNYRAGMARIKKVIAFLGDEVPQKYFQLKQYYIDRIAEEDSVAPNFEEIDHIVKIEKEWYSNHKETNMNWTDLQTKVLFDLVCNYKYNILLNEVTISSGDNNIDSNYFRIEFVDGNHLNLFPVLGNTIEEMLDKREVDSDYLFCNMEGEKLTREYLERHVERAFKEQKFKDIIAWATHQH